MSDLSKETDGSEVSQQSRRILVIVAVSIAVAIIGLIAIAVVLVLNPDVTSAAVEVIRDLFIIVLALSMLLIMVAFIVLLIQVARFVNLMTNEVKPILDTASDTVNTVRGTAEFVSRHVTQPIVTTAGALNGISKVVGDVEMIRKAAGIVMQAAMSSSPMGARAQQDPAASPAGEPEAPSAQPVSEPTKSEPSSKKFESSASIPDNF